VNRATILAILAFPAGVIGFAVTSAVLTGLGLPDALLLIVPLFVGGLCMAPFLLPLFDRMAKRDLAAHRAQQAADAADEDESDKPPD
jgi:hypothetical protein